MNQLILNGLDGANPLGFLAALGALRALTLALPERAVQMSWNAMAGWQPVLHGDIDSDSLLAALHSQIQAARDHKTLGMADDIALAGSAFRTHALEQVEAAHLLRRADPAAYAAAFGCDSVLDDKGNIVDTALRTMSGAGHQHFLQTMREILKATTIQHLHKTLFEQWRYDDPLQSLSLRFDPLDDKRYALRWDDPSGDPSRSKRGNMLGANALAVLGIPSLVTSPVGRRLQTTGFTGTSARNTRWTWPIWDCPASMDVTRSLLALKELQEDSPSRDKLQAIGVVEVYRSQRLTIGKFRNFSPAQPA
jgi:hypothetical protein